MPKFQDWLIVSSLTVGLGAAASVGGITGALLGSTTGAVVGATISQKKSRGRILQDQTSELERIKAESQVLTARVNELRKSQADLAKVEGKFIQKQEELRQVESRFTSLKREEQDLARRVSLIVQQNP